jgi:DNA-binding MarR family transcriptional regulator
VLQTFEPRQTCNAGLVNDRSRPSDVAVLMDLSRALVGLAVRSMAAVDGAVTLPQFRALVVLADRGPCSASELAAAVGLHGSTITRLCDRLLAADLITRQVRPENRRKIELAITPAGAALVRKVWKARERELAAALRRLSTAQRSSLREAAGPLAEIVDGRNGGHHAGWL